MIKLINNSSIPELYDFCIRINSLLIFTDMKESTADKLISLLENNIDDISNIIITLIDKYDDIEDNISGFNKLFGYLIYYNQYFLEHDFIIICGSDDIYYLVSNIIENASVMITATEEKYPVKDDKSIFLVKEYNTLESSLEIDNNILDLKFQLYKKFTEIELNKIEAEFDKDSELPDIDFSPDFNTNNNIDIINLSTFDNKYYEEDNKIKLYQITIIHHTAYKLDLNLSHNNFYKNNFSIKRVESSEFLIMDVYNTKKTKRYFSCDELNTLGLHAKITDKTS